MLVLAPVFKVEGCFFTKRKGREKLSSYETIKLVSLKSVTLVVDNASVFKT
jgi:hypothetical protein